MPVRPTLLLSDLHLPSRATPMRAAFLRFLAGPARQASAVFILGDLFETWVGDDIGLKIHRQEVRAMCDLTESGVRLFVQHGNRDFLLGRRFAQATGAEMLPDPFLVTIHGVATLLSHGDQYCTDDRAYQRWRRFAHWHSAQQTFLRLPPAMRLRVAGDLRNRSAQANQQKTMSIMDVNESEIVQAFHSSQAQRMIHGHTHRPAEHIHLVDGTTRQRVVLADWRPDFYEYLICAPDGTLRRQRFNPSQATQISGRCIVEKLAPIQPQSENQTPPDNELHAKNQAPPITQERAPNP